MHKHLLASSPGRKVINCVASVSRSRHSAPALDFQKSSFELASSPAPESFKFEREDWTLFRTVEGLQQKAGVPATWLRRLVLKEIADNALGAGTRIETGQIDGRGFYVADTGSGIDGAPEDIARLSSIARPLVSTKPWRLATRGAFGNGLRVVAGSIALLVMARSHRNIGDQTHRSGARQIGDKTMTENSVSTPIPTRSRTSFYGVGAKTSSAATPTTSTP